MRKKMLIILLCLIVLSAFVLASCNNGTPVENAVRWENTETRLYDISLALFESDANITNKFDEKDFVNNVVMVSETSTLDEIRPVSVTGTYTTEISTASDKQTFTTQQNLLCTYDSTLEKFVILKARVDALTQAQQNLIVVSNTETQIVLKSYTETSVTFTMAAAQTPLSSSRKIIGYYAGLTMFEVNDIETLTTYSGDTATVTVKSNGQTTVNGEERKVGATKFIDINQILLYQRSLDQTSAFTQTPSVAVYDPITNVTITVSFSLTKDVPTLLNLGENANRAVTNSVACSTSTSMSTVYLYAFFNNPKDIVEVSTGSLNKFTPVKWQYGFLLYESSNYTTQEISQLKYSVAA